MIESEVKVGQRVTVSDFGGIKHGTVTAITPSLPTAYANVRTVCMVTVSTDDTHSPLPPYTREGRDIYCQPETLTLV